MKSILETKTTIPERALIALRLPGIGGDLIAKRLRESPVMRDVAIVMMTAYHLSHSQETRILAMAQTSRLLYKPLPAPSELQKVLCEAVASRHKTQAGA